MLVLCAFGNQCAAWSFKLQLSHCWSSAVHQGMGPACEISWCGYLWLEQHSRHLVVSIHMWRRQQHTSSATAASFILPSSFTFPLRYIWVLASSLACWLSALCAGLIYCLAAAALIGIEAHPQHPQGPCAALCVCHECVSVQAINLHPLLLVCASLRCCRATICVSIVAVLYELQLVCMDYHTLDDMRPCSAACLAQSHSTAPDVSVLSQPLSVSSLWQLCSCTATCPLKQTADMPWVCCCQAHQQLQ